MMPIKYKKILQKIFKLLALIFYPIKPLQYLECYFNMCDLILVHKNAKTIAKINVIIIIGAVKAAHLVYLAFAPNLTDLDRTIHFDGFNMLIRKSIFNMAVCTCALMNLYFDVIKFYDANPLLNSLLRDVLIRNKDNFFLNKRFKGIVANKIVLYVCQFCMYLLHTFSLTFGKLLAYFLKIKFYA